MKKVFSILFLSIFLYNIFGYYIVFKVFQQENKEQMALSLQTVHASPLLQVVEIPLSSIQEKDKDFELVGTSEFRYKGKLYDIAKKEIKNNSIYFYCLEDKKEMNLYASLLNHIKNNMDINANVPVKNKGDKETIKNMLKDYLPLNSHCELISSDELNTITIHYNINYQSLSSEVLSPPPRA